MTRWRRFLDWLTGGLTARPPAVNIGHVEPSGPRFPAISPSMLANMGPTDAAKREAAFRATWRPPAPPPTTDADAKQAMDAVFQAMDLDCSALYGWAGMSAFGDGIGFAGYPYLAELLQRTEYRAIVSTLAEEMTRKWIKITYTGDDREAVKEKLADLKDALERHKIQSLFYHAMLLGDGFGRGHIFIDTGRGDSENASLLVIDKRKIRKGTKLSFRTVEPMWVYPNTYNSSDPLRPDYYRPQSWFVMAKVVHQSRLLTIIPNPVSDILKPAYAFGGVSLTQMAKPYVDNWLRTRQSISDLIHSFSTMILATDLSTLIQGSGQELFARLEMFARGRDNQGVMLVNKDSEELTNVTTPLTTLDELQTQSLDQVCIPAKIPRVKFTGQQPAGLGADSEGEIRVFYDHIHARQELHWRDPLLRVIQIVQLAEFGEIDPDIGFQFEPLYQLDDTAKSANRLVDAQADQVYVTMGAIDNEEVRERLAGDEESPYSGINAAELPEPPADPNEPEPGDKTDAA